MNKIIFKLVFIFLFITNINGQYRSFNKLQVLNFSSTDCLNDAGNKIQPRLIKQELRNDILLIEISVCTDCGSDKCGIAFELGDTLYLDSGFELVKELDAKGNTIEYLNKGAECICGYIYEYKIKTDCEYRVIKYDQKILEYHENHFMDKIKIIGKDTLRIGDGCGAAYELRTNKYTIFYDFYSTGELKTMMQYDNMSDGKYLTVFDRDGKKMAIMWRNNNSDIVSILSWDKDNKTLMNIYNNYEEMKGAKYYEYLKEF